MSYTTASLWWCACGERAAAPRIRSATVRAVHVVLPTSVSHFMQILLSAQTIG
ncbi:hypothetical protein COEREDRAFT_81050 [Coemansia reversa NRRL 1564]|uniref:Uncharacterized protein n=1 Tax=Coemansia reversa (strain ATCC 12441 / NRRL 1564) TaxID=763665 RepID=A0A2G5BCG2_COERN|nr:hypothetical protein COEREDRAFT_81050 [Coemansia reversa NRRL 1564]|eukprot:PIA16682.1 hypothetical protein COEREDRAFT_81050 [Coemansia reversa NRRL 1564]